MRCHRCAGMITDEKIYGYCEYFFWWKCIPCGEIVDPVILDNKRSSPTPGPRAQNRDSPTRERMVIIF